MTGIVTNRRTKKHVDLLIGENVLLTNVALFNYICHGKTVSLANIAPLLVAEISNIVPGARLIKVLSYSTAATNNQTNRLGKYSLFSRFHAIRNVPIGGALGDGQRSARPVQVLLLPQHPLLYLERGYVDVLPQEREPFAFGQVFEIDHLRLRHGQALLDRVAQIERCTVRRLRLQQA